MAKTRALKRSPSKADRSDFDPFVPPELRSVDDPQTAMPAIAKDQRLINLLESAVQQLPTVPNSARKEGAPAQST